MFKKFIKFMVIIVIIGLVFIFIASFLYNSNKSESTKEVGTTSKKVLNKSSTQNEAFIQFYNKLEKAKFSESGIENFTDVVPEYDQKSVDNFHDKMMDIKKLLISQGALCGKIADFDDDGKDELLVLKVLAVNDDNKENHFTIFNGILEMYEENDSIVTLSDSKSICNLENTDSATLTLSTKDKYIVSNYNKKYDLFVNGGAQNLYVFSYDGKKFFNEFTGIIGNTSHAVIEKNDSDYKNIEKLVNLNLSELSMYQFDDDGRYHSGGWDTYKVINCNDLCKINLKSKKVYDYTSENMVASKYYLRLSTITVNNFSALS